MEKLNLHIIKLSTVAAIIVASLFAASCEKEITIDLPDADGKIVVEGYVWQDSFPYVILSRNAAFFSTIDSSDIQNFLVRGAIVTVNDGFTTDTLQELQFGQAVIYVSFNLRGTAGRKYTLMVKADGQQLTAVTEIPGPVALDSVWWKPDGNRDSLGWAWAHLTDPDTLGNAYRWFAKRINKYPGTSEQKDADFLTPPGSVFEDKFINGKSFDFAYNRGRVPNSDKADDLNEESQYYKRGDTIVIRFCTIDQAHFEFWRNLESQVAGNGNPFSNPTPIKSNIQGGLGIWGGYSLTYDTIYAQ